MSTLGEFPLGRTAFGIDPETLVTDSVLTLSSTLYVDELTNDLIVQDPALSLVTVYPSDSLQRVMYDVLYSEPASTFYVDTLRGDINIRVYWRWRFVRQSGHLFLIPAKSAHAWNGADVVSEDFRYNSALLDYAMTKVSSAWASNSGASTATLKTAIDSALSTAGFKAMDGTAL